MLINPNPWERFVQSIILKMISIKKCQLIAYPLADPTDSLHFLFFAG